MLDAAVAARLLAGGAGHDPAAERGVFERLRIVSEHEAVGRSWDSTSGPRAGGDSREPVLRVDVQQPHLAAHVQRDHRPAVVDHLQMPDHAVPPP